MSELFIGLMSGTSLDGADGVLAQFSGADGADMAIVASASRPFPAQLRTELLQLNTPGGNELHRAAQAASQLVRIYAEVVQDLLKPDAGKSNLPTPVMAIGAHGQTVRHQPPGLLAGQAPYSWQLNNPALLAELTGIDVVADFRSRDIAAGGQGAPLVPAFHRSVFSQATGAVCVLNIGGIANLSVLPSNDQRRTALGGSGGDVVGFDCGPGNALMDAWCQRYTGQAYDLGGAWAATGQLVPELLQRLMDEPYLQQPPPKSTGRDLFSMAWLDAKLAPFAGCRPQDIQYTLTEYTASACVACINRYGNDSKLLVVCGGGAFNTHLMQRLQAGLPGVGVSRSDAHGLPPLQVEAAAFAWLARQAMHRQPGNLAGVTGAAGPRVLGAIYPA